MATDATRDEILKWISQALEKRQFKTGRRGYGAYGKVDTPDGKRYQVSLNAVEIGSK